MRNLLAIAVLALPALGLSQGWDKVAKALGRPGVERDGVYRINYPRRDLSVTVGEIKLAPGFALTTWVAFQPMTGHRSRFAMVMGDFVSTAEELPVAQSALLKGGFEITGVHNHLAGTQPGLIYMHFSAKGDPEELATKFLTALRTTKAPTDAPPAPDLTNAPDWSGLERVLNRKGTNNGRVYNLSVPRADKILEAGEPLMPLNGAASSVNFQSLGEGRCALTTDLILLKDEVRPVVAALHRNGITVTALHNHMLEDEPRTFHLHVWAVGETEKLASAMAEALALTDSKK